MYDLNQNEINFFRRAGYIKLPWRFEGDFMDSVLELLNKNLNRQVRPYKRDKNGNIIKMFNLFNRDEQFRKIYTSPLLINPLRSLLGPNIEFLKNRHNHVSVIKSNSAEKRLHRDVLYWSRPIVVALIYPQDSNTSNGCTEIIPTSQHLPFVPPRDNDLPKHAGTWLDEYEVYKNFDNQSVPIFMKKGEILLFDGLVFHTAGVNSTNKARYVITAAYHSVDELMPETHDDRKILVSGRRVYCGNEYNWE